MNQESTPMLNPRPHKKLKVWQKAIDLVVKIYKVTGKFPKNEEFGITVQLRRAAVSVPSNIAEGLTRKSSKDKIHFLNIAQSSLSEIDTQLEISIRLDYFNQETYESIEKDLMEIQMMLSGLSRSIE
jgi:four helix bundle protein